MVKPFVVITPEKDREALRNSGVLPESFFRPFDVESNGLRTDDDNGIPPVYLWPYELRYTQETERTDDGVFKPDIPSYFGLNPPVNDAERRHNERLITGLLSSVMVHVVFLDSRRGENGYAAFTSFDEVVKWGQSLRKALNVRFRNEETLLSMESVLVLVARGEQITLRPSDVAHFNDCVQLFRGDQFSIDPETGESMRKVFQSCYFLDYNLCVRDSRELYHAAEVWDIVVGRLLLSFLMSSKTKTRWWQIPGIKLWRSLDCMVDVDADSDRRVVGEALAEASAKLQDLAAKAESLDRLSLLHRDPVPQPPIKDVPLLPADAGHDGWRREPEGGWSDFGGESCVVNADQDSEGVRWKPSFDRIRDAFRYWKIKHRETQDDKEVPELFQAIHASPGNLFKATEGVYAKLARTGLPPGRNPEANWRALLAAEESRQKAIAQIRVDVPEFRKAQNHFVGLGVSAFAAASVCSALGLSAYYLLRVLSGSRMLPASDWSLALGVFALFVVGAIGAVALMYLCHSRAGRRGMAAIVEESLAVDEWMEKRDQRARDLVEQGILVRDWLRLQSLRFRSWALLKRARDMLVTELQPTLSQKTNAEIVADAQSAEGEHLGVRETFLSRTRKVFGPYRIAMKEELRVEMSRLISLWWSERAFSLNPVPLSETDNFFELWKGLCAEDQMSSGYLPARPFSEGIRSFVSRYTDSVRSLARNQVLSDHQNDLRSGIADWYDDLQRGEYYLYATGAVTGEHVNEDSLENARVYFADCVAVDLDRIHLLQASAQADQSRFMPESRDELNRTKHLALMFQEIKVRFDCDAADDAEYGHLVFKEIEDVVGGETNG